MAAHMGRQAVVLGGSMAGLLAARALSGHFEQVTILERDALNTSLSRKGVPQAQHTHGLLAGGLLTLEEFFPGIRSELIQRGALEGDLLADSRWIVNGGCHLQCDSGLTGLLQSRALLERVVRARTLKLPNVSLRDQVRVDALVTAPRDLTAGATERVVGVCVSDVRDGRDDTLSADLVVDATGRGSRLPAWLSRLGYQQPREDVVSVDLLYATRLYRREPDDFGGDRAVIILQEPPNTRFGIALAVEHGLWSVTLGGMRGDFPPSDAEAYTEFARGLPSPVLHEMLSMAEPVSPVATYRFPGSLRRRYEQLPRFPDGLLAMGDALCSFNPVYGQGMTVAALEAKRLDALLSQGVDDLPRRFFRAAAQIVDIPWQIAVTADFRFPHVRGPKPSLARLMNAYLDRVHATAHTDKQVAIAFHRVANLLDQPSALLRPGTVGRVLAKALFRSADRRDTRRLGQAEACTPTARGA